MTDDLYTPDTCALCDEPLGEPLSCYCCRLSVCPGCSVTDAAGDVLCETCADDMHFFLEGGEVIAGDALSHGQGALPQPG